MAKKEIQIAALKNRAATELRKMGIMKITSANKKELEGIAKLFGGHVKMKSDVPGDDKFVSKQSISTADMNKVEDLLTMLRCCESGMEFYRHTSYGYNNEAIERTLMYLMKDNETLIYPRPIKDVDIAMYETMLGLFQRKQGKEWEIDIGLNQSLTNSILAATEDKAFPNIIFALRNIELVADRDWKSPLAKVIIVGNVDDLDGRHQQSRLSEEDKAAINASEFRFDEVLIELDDKKKGTMIRRFNFEEVRARNMRNVINHVKEELAKY